MARSDITIIANLQDILARILLEPKTVFLLFHLNFILMLMIQTLSLPSSVFLFLTS